MMWDRPKGETILEIFTTGDPWQHLVFFGDSCDYEPTELVGSRCFSLDFFKNDLVEI